MCNKINNSLKVEIGKSVEKTRNIGATGTKNMPPKAAKKSGRAYFGWFPTIFPFVLQDFKAGHKTCARKGGLEYWSRKGSS